MKDYSDYYQYTWNRVEPAPRPIMVILARIPLFLAIIALGLYLFIPKIINEVDKPGQVLYFIFIVTLCLLVVLGINFMLNILAKARGPKLSTYTVNKTGIQINRRTIPFTTINKAETLTLLVPLLLPKNLWTDEPQTFSLTLPTTKKPITLFFPEENSRQNALVALQHYLSHTA